MHQLLYRSRASEMLESSEVFRIVETSARNNPAREITGFLIFARDTFLQLIEGPPEALDTLLADLAIDDRHHSIEVLAREVIDTRSFPGWRMQRIALGEGQHSNFIAEITQAGVGEHIIEHLGNALAPRKAA